ncbi:hypothetical protein VTN49DRAFT_4022 [Thermomyces lanuginosus]|uniref:uncharacterized protein n=1 Tax=Thermomyces lanuginosus TaxID=5541 RepID=UPI0037438671
MSSRQNGVAHRDEDEVCPVCKSSRYLNPDMRFLINPECYHKMCESCVDRIFSSGPAPCPVAGCHKTLRKNRFRKQTFEDIGVEREVDIRRRVMGILNRHEDEFDSKRAWDDFLELRETIIFNLVHGIDVAKTEADLRSYEAANRDSIRANKAREARENASFLEQQSFEQEQARLRRLAAREEQDINERQQLAAGREDVLSRLAAGKPGDAATIAQEGHKVLLKKSSARRSEEERLRRKQAALRGDIKGVTSTAPSSATSTPTPTSTPETPTPIPTSMSLEGGFIKGLKKKEAAPEADKPYDPFGGLDPHRTRDYYVLADSYPSAWLDRIRDDVRIQAGGYDLRDYYARSMQEAFAGLGCFIDEEVVARNSSPATAATATEGAAMAAVSSS